MENPTVVHRGGLGLSSVLTIIFVVLKFVHVIAWSWWWVFSPLWIPAAVVLFIWLLLLLIAMIGALFA